ncbi:transcriptional regulator with XRE-family HTH domain [Mucilaginibacter sp. SG538B]|uniref:helix-turn-helix domain-containing protein n=1 Tax=Mucilaginibacter sp. SG538B TaxID=2587021 RepID=UPI00159E6F34|nr:helix-turn-helix domain-containing protein [Mucilaginibacter sp. SG538B]NVM64193.1 transcriptional regulator with XRE-family HTH domain [Mucilaginibacter sp. SG538B]NVM64232.1 transcriptional regulator with XRE-family HTH domain [Mucilaginibacter sp. SG538B]
MKDQLRYYRQQNDLEYEDVAFMLEIPVSNYADMENGISELPLKLMIKLCRFYGIKPDELKSNPEKEPGKPAEPLADNKHDLVHEVITISDGEEDDGHDYPPKYDLDRSKRKISAKQAIAILKKKGTEINEEEAEKVLDFIYKMAPIAISIAVREIKWQQKLRDHPNGFAIKGKKYSCQLCGNGSDENQRWYDRFGLKCMACQSAVNKGIVSGEIVSNHSLFYTEFNLDHYFGLKGKDLKDWIKKGLLKPRVIPRSDGKGKHYQVFLVSDHSTFLPPIAMMRIGGLVEEEENGKIIIRNSHWYEHVNPFEYLKDYAILKYMKYKEPPTNPPATL